MFPRTILMGAGAGAGLFEIAQAPFLDMAAGRAMALGFAAAFLVAAWLLRTRTTGPAMALLALFGLELAFLPVYDRATVTDWVLQVGFGALALVGLVAALAVLGGRWRGTATRAQSLRTRT